MTALYHAVIAMQNRMPLAGGPAHTCGECPACHEIAERALRGEP